MADEDIPGIFVQQMKGALRYQRALCRDYTECVKEKEIADRSSTTWEETVERLVRIAFLYGHMTATARQNNQTEEALTEREREMTPNNLPVE